MSKNKKKNSGQQALFPESTLPTEQRDVLAFLRRGEPLEEAAKHADVEPKEVRTWLRSDPSFAQAWEDLKREQEDALLCQSRTTAQVALQTLTEVMQAEEEGVSIQPSGDFKLDAVLAKLVLDERCTLLNCKVKAAKEALAVIPKHVWGELQKTAQTSQKQAQEAASGHAPMPSHPQELAPEKDPVVLKWQEQRGDV